MFLILIYSILLFGLSLFFILFYFYLEMQQAPRNQKISEAKLNKLLEQNTLLKQQLDVPRIPISEASARFAFFFSSSFNYKVWHNN